MFNGLELTTANYFVLAAVLVSFCVSAAFTYWMMRNGERIVLPLVLWVFTILFVVFGLRYVLSEGESQKEVLYNFYLDVVDIMAHLTEEKGHYLISHTNHIDSQNIKGTPYDDITTSFEHLCKNRKTQSIGYIYTLRLVDYQKTVIVCDAAVDINNDGYIDGVAEERIKIGTPYEEWEDIFRLGFEGKKAVAPTFSRKYGEWITAVAPLYNHNVPDLDTENKKGKVEAILCVDFDPKHWNVVVYGIYSRSLIIFISVFFIIYLGIYLVAARRISLRALKCEHEKLLVAEKKALIAAEAKQCFLTNINREVRTPMNAILGMTQIIHSKVNQHVPHGVFQEIEGLVRLVQKNGETLLELIDGVLELSQVDVPSAKLHETWFPIRSFLAEITAKAKPNATARGLSICWDCPSSTPIWVKSDAAKITRILWLTIDNAIKFTPTGSVTIRASIPEPISQNPQKAENPDQHRKLLLQVQDTGIGISPEKQVALFEAFSQIDSSSTRRYGGVGIGLAIVARLMEILRGQVEINSQVGVGTVVQLTIDVAISTGGERPNEDDEMMVSGVFYSGTFDSKEYGPEAAQRFASGVM